MTRALLLALATVALGCGGGSDGFAVALERDSTDEAASDAVGETVSETDAATDDATDATSGDASDAVTDTGSDTGTPPVDSGPPDTGSPDAGPEAEACVDGDGDGDPSVTCGGLDCHDGNKLVSSKQTDWFDKSYTAVGGAASFDYNCSGKTEYEYPTRYECYTAPDGLGCIFKKGYTGSFTPACGTKFELAVGCTYRVSDAGVPSCISYVATGDLTMATQRCH